MKSRRMLREGSLGLLILLGLGLFGSFVLWLRGFSFGKQNYTVVIEFRDIAKMQIGAPVRYRGVVIGSVTEIDARSNHVDVEIQITPATLRIPRKVRIEANQAGFIGETSIDIFPFQEISIAATKTNPLDRNCKPDLIICDRDRLQGEIGVTFDELLRNSLNFTKLFSNPQFFGSLNQLIQNTTIVTGEVSALSRDLQKLTQVTEKELGKVSTLMNTEITGLSGDLRQLTQLTERELGKFSTTVNTEMSGLSGDVRQLTQLTERELGKLSTTAIESANTINQSVATIGGTVNELGSTAKEITASINEFGSTANEIGSTVSQLQSTATELNSLVSNVNGLVVANRSTLVQTLDNLSQTSEELQLAVNNVNGLVVANRSTLVQTLDNISQTTEDLQVAVNRLDPAIAQVETGLNQAKIPELLANLEQMSVNAVQVSSDAAQATANLRDLSNPTNLILLQQTLDSARATFENAEKITSDLDRLTGDPTFFNDLRQLLDSLNDLLSVTEQLEEQTAIAHNLDPIRQVVNQQATSVND